MSQLKQRYIECYEANKAISTRNQSLELELIALKTTQSNNNLNNDANPLHSVLQPSSSPPQGEGKEDKAEPTNMDDRDAALGLERRQEKRWRNTQMMMFESHKTEKLELMAQVEELKEKVKSLTNDLLEMLEENERLSKRLETEERTLNVGRREGDTTP